MTKKREPFTIDLMDDTDSYSAEAPKTKTWKRPRKGSVFQESIDEVIDDPFPPHDYENPDCDPSAFGRIDWRGFIHDANEVQWQKKRREEQLDEGAIAYLQEVCKGMHLETPTQFMLAPLPLGSASLGDEPVNPAIIQLSVQQEAHRWLALRSTDKPRLWLNNPFRPYIYGQHITKDNCSHG